MSDYVIVFGLEAFISPFQDGIELTVALKENNITSKLSTYCLQGRICIILCVRLCVFVYGTERKSVCVCAKHRLLAILMVCVFILGYHALLLLAERINECSIIFRYFLSYSITSGMVSQNGNV